MSLQWSSCETPCNPVQWGSLSFAAPAVRAKGEKQTVQLGTYPSSDWLAGSYCVSYRNLQKGLEPAASLQLLAPTVNLD
jgi:hypothetical protein